LCGRDRREEAGARDVGEIEEVEADAGYSASLFRPKGAVGGICSSDMSTFAGSELERTLWG
jgi:hypothetical protein